MLKELTNRQYIIINDGAENFRLRTYYIRPKEQIKQLTDLGFTNVKIYGLYDGREMDPSELESAIDPWLYYLCTVS